MNENLRLNFYCRYCLNSLEKIEKKNKKNIIFMNLSDERYRFNCVVFFCYFYYERFAASVKRENLLAVSETLDAAQLNSIVDSSVLAL